MQESLKFLSYRPESVSPQQFRAWLDNPCTQGLKKELIQAFFLQMDEDIPASIDSSVPIVHQREGARKTLDLLFNWEPESIREARERSPNGIIEEVDSND